MMDYVVSLVIHLHVLLGIACAESELNLIRDLMDRYDPDVRPSHDVQEPITVALDITLHQIIEVDARDQVLTCSVWQRMYWKDEHLHWDPAAYDGIKRIRLSAERIWKPDIALVNDVAGETHANLLEYPAVISHDGAVRWLAPRLIHTSCNLDMTYFPWDNQNCVLEFSSWTHDRSELLLTNISTEADTTTDYIENGEWDLVRVPVSLYLQPAPCCDEPFVVMNFQVHIRRKAKYYVGNLIFPSALITTAGMLVFCLPAASGEKVSLSVTILLATTVYQLLLADRMPVQSVTTPVIGTYIMFTQILLGLATALTVIVISLYHQGSCGRRVPRALRAIVRALACPLGLRATARKVWGEKTNKSPSKDRNTGRTHSTENQNLVNHVTSSPQIKKPDPEESTTNNTISSLSPYMKKITSILDNFESTLTAKDQDDRTQCEWMFVSQVVDRLFLVLFGVSVFVCTLALLTGHDNYRME